MFFILIRGYFHTHNMTAFIKVYEQITV